MKSWKVDESLTQPEEAEAAIKWFDSKLQQSIGILGDYFDRFRLSEALMTVYKLFWDEFSSWYLEIVKPKFQMPVDSITFNHTIEFLDKLLHLLHPFMPFITEEIWQLIIERNANESLMISPMPVAGKFNTGIIKHFEQVKEIIAKAR